MLRIKLVLTFAIMLPCCQYAWSANLAIPTRQNVFAIPFSLGSAAHQSVDGAREVQLLVSNDQGAHWAIYDRQPPTSRRFHFRAPQDGEYWFRVLTIGRNDRVIYQERSQQELRVKVDTTEPGLLFTVRTAEAQQVIFQWLTTDESIDSSSFKIQFSVDGGVTWKQVDVGGQNTGHRNGSNAHGHHAWVSPFEPRGLLFRAEVSDQAGNTTVVHQRASSNSDSVDTAANTSPKSQSAEPNNRQVPWPAKRTLASPTPHGDNPEGWRTERPTDTRSALRNPTSQAHGPSDREASADRSPRNSNDVPTRPISLSKDTAAPTSDQANAQVATLFSRSRRFELDYIVNDQVEYSRVELWSSVDGGRNWRHFADDLDRQSPFRVKVEGEGTYGFRLIFHRSNGIPTRTPRPGDPADVWVIADWTKPSIQLKSAHYGKGGNSGQLVIQWEAEDRELGTNPIAVLYSPHRYGPWTAIKTELPNSGQFSWQPDTRVPRSFYLRIEVRDEVGNESTDQLDYPISVDGLSPRGRILNIRPIPETATRPAFRDSMHLHLK